MHFPKKQLLKPLFILALVLGLLGAFAGLVFGRDTWFYLIFLFPITIGFLQLMSGSAVAFVLAAVVSLAGFSLMSGRDVLPRHLFFMADGFLWTIVLMFHFLMDRVRKKNDAASQKLDEVLRKKKTLLTEIEFYEQRERGLAARNQQRQLLSTIACDLGGEFDTAVIQEKLMEAAKTLFGHRFVQITIGQNPDDIDRFVMGRKQSLMVPSSGFTGAPLVAAPLTAQGAVVGVLRIGGEPGGSAFEREDLRALEILASLASSALDNAFLFVRVQENALRDHLTGLWTQKAFRDHLEAEILNASRYGQHFSLILLDVDHFKSVNDTHGHQAGDCVLQGVAQTLARNIREVDVLSRYGGEEFVIVCLDATKEEARAKAELLRASIEKERFDSGGQILSVTASFGVATFPDDATSAQQLLRRADERLYQAKKAGRNRVVAGVAA